MENNNEQRQNSDKLSPIDLRKANASQIEAHIIEFEKFNAKAEVFFDNQRISIDEQMNVLFDVLRIQDYKQYIILQSNAMALRQTIQEHISKFLNKLSRANANYKVACGNRHEYYMTGYGIKIAEGMKSKLVDRDLSERERNIELYQTHIEYLRDSSKSCADIQYAVKNAIALFTYLNTEK